LLDVLEGRRMRIDNEYWTEKTRPAIDCAIWLKVMTAKRPAAVQELARAIDNCEKEQVK
jgi:hypothetical protein